jgi:alpha-N-arabinofuranosidase
LRVDPGATAVLRLAAADSDGGVFFRELRLTVSASQPELRRDIFDVPNHANLTLLILSCTVEGTSGSAYFDDLTVSTQVPSTWFAATGGVDAGLDLSASVTVQARNVLRTIPRAIYGTNVEWVYGGNGIWDASKGDFDPITLQLTQDLGATLMRFPSGFFSDFYHWQNGIGDRAQRPPSRMLAIGSLSPNDFGTDEALRFAQVTGGDLMITVNITTGTPKEAAAWVSYINQ